MESHLGQRTESTHKQATLLLDIAIAITTTHLQCCAYGPHALHGGLLWAGQWRGLLAQERTQACLSRGSSSAQVVASLCVFLRACVFLLVCMHVIVCALQ
jgi:hypothetical protein